MGRPSRPSVSVLDGAAEIPVFADISDTFEPRRTFGRGGGASAFCLGPSGEAAATSAAAVNFLAFIKEGSRELHHAPCSNHSGLSRSSSVVRRSDRRAAIMFSGVTTSIDVLRDQDASAAVTAAAGASSRWARRIPANSSWMSVPRRVSEPCALYVS